MLKIPGGYDASQVYEKIVAERDERARQLKAASASAGGANKTKGFAIAEPTPEEPFQLFSYYISRFQASKHSPTHS